MWLHLCFISAPQSSPFFFFGRHQTSVSRPLIRSPGGPGPPLQPCTAPSHQSASSHLSVHPFPCPAHLAAQWDCVDSPSLESSSYQTHVEGLISRWAFASAWRVWHTRKLGLRGGQQGLRGGPLDPLQQSKLWVEQIDMGSLNIPMFDNNRHCCQSFLSNIGPILSLLWILFVSCAVIGIWQTTCFIALEPTQHIGNMCWKWQHVSEQLTSLWAVAFWTPSCDFKHHNSFSSVIFLDSVCIVKDDRNFDLLWWTGRESLGLENKEIMFQRE